MELRARLGEVGIQTSMNRRGAREMEVLVLRDDLDAARAVLKG